MKKLRHPRSFARVLCTELPPPIQRQSLPRSYSGEADGISNHLHVAIVDGAKRLLERVIVRLSVPQRDVDLLRNPIEYDPARSI